MSDADAIIEKPEEPNLSQEEQDEQDILAQDDALETLVRAANDPFGNLIATSLHSAKANKKVITYYDYAEELDSNDENKVKGRSIQGTRKSSVTVDTEITEVEPSIVARRAIERG